VIRSWTDSKGVQHRIPPSICSLLNSKTTGTGNSAEVLRQFKQEMIYSPPAGGDLSEVPPSKKDVKVRFSLLVDESCTTTVSHAAVNITKLLKKILANPKVTASDKLSQSHGDQLLRRQRNTWSRHRGMTESEPQRTLARSAGRTRQRCSAAPSVLFQPRQTLFRTPAASSA